MSIDRTVVFGVVPTRALAELVVADLNRAHFLTGDISILIADNGGTRDVVFETGTKASEGAVVGGSAGGALGGALGLLAGLGVLVLPGLGAFLVAGPIMAALSGVAVGSAVGSITGALVGLGLPEIQAKAYEGKVKGGAALVSVHTENAEQVVAARAALEIHGAQDISSTAELPVPTAQGL